MHSSIGRAAARTTKLVSDPDRNPFMVASGADRRAGEDQAADGGRAKPKTDPPFLPNKGAQLWPPPSSLTDDAIRDGVVANGREYGVEFLVAVDGDGQLVESIRGSSSETGLTKNLQDALLDPASRLTVHHNHPSGSPLSRNDLAFLAFPGLSAVFAHTSTAGVVLTSHARLTAQGRDAFDRDIEQAGIYGAFYTLHHALHRPFSFDCDVQEQIWQGLLDGGEANLCNKLALFAAMNRSGLFWVDNTFPLPSLFDRVDIQQGIDKLATQIARLCGSSAALRALQKAPRRNSTCRATWTEGVRLRRPLPGGFQGRHR